MPLTDHVSLLISQDSVGIARAGFGVPLILSNTAAWVERTRVYNDIAGVAIDFPDASSWERVAANAMFSQTPRPEKIKVGRCALPPTQKFTIQVASVRNLTPYTVKVAGAGVTSTTVTITSGASATADTIVTALTAALNAVVGKNYLAVGVTSTCTITAATAGAWFSLEVDPADLTAMQTHIDPGLATDLTAISLADGDWYALCTGYNSKACVLAAAAWVEANKKIYLPSVSDSDSVTASGGAGTLSTLFGLTYARTMGAYHPSPAVAFAAAWLGRCLPLEPGSETWKYKSLAGVPAVKLTPTHRANLIAKRANSYETVAGRNITFEGSTFAANGFLDIIRGIDWLDDDMSKGVFGSLAGADKVPYTDPGIARIETEVRASLTRATARGILASNPAFIVIVPLVSAAAPADRAARILRGVTWSAQLAGAIHGVRISGTIVI